MTDVHFEVWVEKPGGETFPATIHFYAGEHEAKQVAERFHKASGDTYHVERVTTTRERV